MTLAHPFLDGKRKRLRGWGREMGEHGLAEYLNVKSVWIDTEISEG